MPHEDLLALTATADFGLSLIEPVSLSYEYCMPNKLFEYMMAGVPVIVSPTVEQRKLVERYGSGIVARSSSAADARATGNSGIDALPTSRPPRPFSIPLREERWAN